MCGREEENLLIFALCVIQKEAPGIQHCLELLLFLQVEEQGREIPAGPELSLQPGVAPHPGWGCTTAHDNPRTGCHKMPSVLKDSLGNE